MLSHQLTSSQGQLIPWCKTPATISFVAFSKLPYGQCDTIYARYLSQPRIFIAEGGKLGGNEGNLAFTTSKTQQKEALVLMLT